MALGSGPGLGRLVVGTGLASDLSLLIGSGVMPVSGGQRRLRQRCEAHDARRSQEVDAADPDVHVPKPERAFTDWQRLEPTAVGHRRP